MPIYEYQCKACNEKVEVLQKMDDKPIRKCPECGKNQLVKLVSAAAFRLKGSGWYETDFKSGNKKNLHANETGSDKSSGSGADKPAADQGAKDGGKSESGASGKKDSGKKPSAKKASGKKESGSASKPA